MEMFEKLNSINVNDHTEDKNGLTYLSWVWAWSEIKKNYPSATYSIKKFENNLPYVYDENTGYMVFTEVTIDGETQEMWLPVMDGNNKAMLNHPYTYKVKKYANGKFTGEYEEKQVNKATMFDINKTLMRCLVKNIAMFGLGIYIYAGEDMPEGYEMTKEEAEKVILTFGKHDGETLKEVFESDISYLNWLIDNDRTKQSLKDAASLLIKDKDAKNKQEMDNIKDYRKALIEYCKKNGKDMEDVAVMYNLNEKSTDEDFRISLEQMKGI